MHGDAALGQLRLHRLEGPEEVGALAVEHVDDADARDPELVGALPQARGADLDAHDAAEDEDGAFDHAQGRERVALEAGVARRVHEVELPPLPFGMADGGGERHGATVLLVVPVGHRRGGVDGAEPVDLSALEQHGLDERGLPRAAVPDDGDVADLARLDYGHQPASSSVETCRGRSRGLRFARVGGAPGAGRCGWSWRAALRVAAARAAEPGVLGRRTRRPVRGWARPPAGPSGAGPPSCAAARRATRSRRAPRRSRAASAPRSSRA